MQGFADMTEGADWSKIYRLDWLGEPRRALQHQYEGICCQGSFFEGKVNLHFIVAFVLGQFRVLTKIPPAG